MRYILPKVSPSVTSFKPFQNSFETVLKLFCFMFISLRAALGKPLKHTCLRHVAVYRVAQKLSPYQESSLNRIKTHQQS